MKFSFTLFLFLVHFVSFGQIKYNTKPKVDTEVKLLYDEAEKCIKIPGKDCKYLFLKAIEFGKKHKVSYMDYLYFQLGFYFDVRSQYDSAQYYNKKAYELVNKKDPNSAYLIILNSMGANYFRSGDYDNAASYMLLTVKELETQDNPLALVYAYNNLATVLGINENDEEAIKYYKKGYNILEKIKDTTIIANLASNTAIYVKKTNNFPEARKWALKAIQLAEQHHNPSAFSYGNYIMGTTEKDLDKSLSYIKKAVDKAREFQYLSILGDALDIYGTKLSEKGRHEEAKRSIEEAIKIHLKSGYNTGLYSAYANAGIIYYNASDYKTSSEYYKKFKELYDKILPEENKKRINDLNTKYKTEKKEKTIAEQELKIQKQRSNLLYAILGSALFITMLGGIFIYNRKAQQLKLKRLQQEKENAILNSFILGEERERGRISHELHDGVAAMIGAAKMSLESIPHLSPEKQLAQLAKVTGILENTHADVRHIAHNLFPTVLEKEGLVKATEQFASELNETKLINVKVTDKDSKAQKLSQQLQLMLFRVIQELVNNIIKHAQAQHAVITFSNHPNGLQIDVLDDGIGYEESTGSGGQGLYSITQRIKSIGGEFKIITTGDKGSQATTTIPVADKN
ncbi:ATP-binding protein [Pedobacter insulae]|uniref:Histidine kinase-, DNA gyrase B-, and HSP90-like ATPase n=1 Tax=Pedobacter insulae TaxID=414048 RepID=A0A1I2XG18_9SPHI|nr:sensor histidine kinase [Pedobacter insulae]SFH12433.1 Histidine kinase-, DNA gyrase B-, and HSP90-like ATPase [Pedobacter insulae]